MRLASSPMVEGVRRAGGRLRRTLRRTSPARMPETSSDVAVPLRALAEYWVAYYWPFTNPAEPIMQGPRSQRGGVLRNDVSFRPQLTQLRQEWEASSGSAKAADGFWLINELRVPRKRASYPSALSKLYMRAVNSISKAHS